MGRPKAWLPLGNETLLHRIARIVAGACPRVVVVASPGQSLPTLPDGVVRVDDPVARAGQGPLVGALTGMRALLETPAELVYLGAVDAAWLSVDHVEAMLAVLESDPSIHAVVPESAADEEGRPIVHATSGAVRLPIARDAAGALVHAGARALRLLFDELASRRVASGCLPDRDALRPCNTPQDHAAAQRWIASRE
jgi:molybdopterin-guanine dinucleotide biosynthesis protein A